MHGDLEGVPAKVKLAMEILQCQNKTNGDTELVKCANECLKDYLKGGGGGKKKNSPGESLAEKLY